MVIYEIIGYVGSVLVAVSLTMKNILKLRWINFIGAATFAIYGGLIGAYPVLVLNGFIAVVDLYYLRQMYGQKDYFKIVMASGPEDNLLSTFLDFYKDEIEYFYPGFSADKFPDAEYCFILRNMIPAGLFAFTETTDDTIYILLDFAVPDYRDLKNAQFLYYTTDFMRARGYKKLITMSSNKMHENYLKEIGFEEKDTTGNVYVKNL